MSNETALKALHDLAQSHEEWLMQRILDYAIRYDYAKYTSTLIEPWRLSICGLSEPLMKALERGRMDLELSPDEDYTQDLISAFGIEEAQRHRERGVDIAMFLGLFKYYRQSYRDLLDLGHLSTEDTAIATNFLERFFDRIELGLCKEWAEGGEEGQHLRALQVANRQMTNEKNKYLTLFESLADPVLLLDEAGKLENLNQAAADLFHLSGNRYYHIHQSGNDDSNVAEFELSDLLGQPIEAVLPWLQDDVKAFLKQEKAVFEREKTLLTPEGERHYQIRLSAMQDISGKFTGTLLIFEDRTKLRDVEASLRKAKNAAEAANQAKSEFLAAMSHELRTPLNSILGFSQILRGNPDLYPALQEELGIINRSGEHLLNLINQVLDLAKIESGRMSLNPHSFNLRSIFEQVREVFRLQAEQKGLRLLFEGQENVPQYVHGDEVKLRQILLNLVSNAVKFTEEGGVSLRARAEKTADDVYLYCEIEDSGPGMNTEELKHIFQPFVQTRQGKILQEGTGLGLSLSQRFVELLGGKISVKSEPGHGTLFQFYVRLLPAVAESVKPKIVTQRVVGLAPGQKTFKLLIVDDRADNRLLLCRLFEPLGFALRQAVNGEEATHISQTWTPDLVWMDIRMPVMDGYDATKQIKALPNGAQIKIVALTASAFESQQAHINAAGCDGFLRKPFQVGEVFNILHKQLGVRFVYSDSESEVAVNANPARLELSKMSPAWRQAFKEAVESIDLDSARRLAMEVSQVDKSMAKLMRDLIENYRFDTLQSLLEKYDAD